MTKRSHAAWALLFVCILLFTTYLLAERPSARWNPLSWLTKDWVHFDVPSAPLKTRGRVELRATATRICNDNSTAWGDTVIKLTNRVVAGSVTLDSAFYAKGGTIPSGGCVDVSDNEFYSASWKKVPAPAQMNIVKVEILAKVQGAGYFEQEYSADEAHTQ